MEIETEKKVRTIEQTSKKLKLQILIAWALVIGGIIWQFNMDPHNATSATFVIPALMIVVGIVLWIVTKFSIWWHHK